MSRTETNSTPESGYRQGPKDLLARCREIGAELAQDLGVKDSIDLLCSCRGAKPLGAITVQIHDDITAERGQWVEMTMAGLGTWFADQGQRVVSVKRNQPALCIDLGEEQQKKFESVRARRMLGFDNDGTGAAVPLNAACRVFESIGVAWCAHESFSTLPTAPRWHAFIGYAGWIVYDRALRSPVALRFEQALLQGFLGELLGVQSDACAGTAGRLFFAGNRPGPEFEPRRGYGADGPGLDHDRVLNALGWLTIRSQLIEEGHCFSADGQGVPPGCASNAAAHEAAVRALPPSLNSTFRRIRFEKWLAKAQPSYPQMPRNGAGSYTIWVASIGVVGLLLDPETVADLMLKSPWNARCHDGHGQPYPWTRAELLHKARGALSHAVVARLGYMLYQSKPQQAVR